MLAPLFRLVRLNPAILALPLDRYKHEKDIATYIKKNLDEMSNGGTWHVIVGKKFGCSVAHASQQMAYFADGKMNVLAFQSYEIDLTAASSS